MQTIIFIGIQASGKSTLYVQRFANTHMRINLDMLKTRHREDIFLQACLEARQSFVVDNTNPTKRDRKKYIEKFKPEGFRIIGYYLRSSIEECLARNEQRPDKDRIPEKGILSTYHKLQIPEYSEGFDELYYVSIQDSRFHIQEWQSKA